MTDQLDTLLSETRRFPPPADFAARAVAQPGIHERAAKDPEAFWAEEARRLDGYAVEPLLEWNPPHARWFSGGTLNVAVTASTAISPRRRNKAAHHLGRRAG